jgi:NAD(P)-dependent dehydrogenase (short-subunit alcohol dehydrogenase family)
LHRGGILVAQAGCESNNREVQRFAAMKIIRGKKALVTGAASGIGRAIAIALAREGADLYLIDIDKDNLEVTAHQARCHGTTIVTAVCDLARPAEISVAVAALLSNWNRLEILVNNAGIAYHGPTHEMNREQWDRLIAVNLLAPIQLVRELLPTLLRADEAHIINVCSMLGLVTIRKTTAYQTSKFGLVGFTAALRSEYSRSGFGVTALCPGFVHTPMVETFISSGPNNKRAKLPAWACTTAERVADKAIAAVRRNRGLVLVTPMARLLWWLARISPSFADWVNREGWRRRKRVEIGPRSPIGGNPVRLPEEAAE